MYVSVYSGKIALKLLFLVDDVCSDQYCFLAEEPGMERFGTGWWPCCLVTERNVYAVYLVPSGVQMPLSGRVA